MKFGVALIISLIGVLFSFIAAANNLFGLGDKIRKLILKWKIIKTYSKLVLKKYQRIQLPIIFSDEISNYVDIEDLFIALPIRENTRKSTPSFFHYTPQLEQKHNAHSFSNKTSSKEFVSIVNEIDLIGNLLEKQHNLLILGERGSGKTTLMKWIACSYSSRNLNKNQWKYGLWSSLTKKRWVPLIINCNELINGKNLDSIESVFQWELDKFQQGELWKGVLIHKFLKLLKAGKLLILVDGLDELSTQQIKIKLCRILNTTSQLYPESKILITSLNTSINNIGEYLEGDYRQLKIETLSKVDKNKYIDNWAKLLSQKSGVKEYAEILNSKITGSLSLERLTGNIQNLSLIVQLYSVDKSLPDRLTEIYSKAIRSILKKANFVAKVDVSREEVMTQLEIIAYQIRKQQSVSISHVEAKVLLQKYKSKFAEATKNWMEVDSFLNFVISNTGILEGYNLEKKRYGAEGPKLKFSHQSFLNFFAAQAILHGRIISRIKSYSIKKQIIEIIANIPIEEEELIGVNNLVEKELVIDPNWQEILEILIPDLSDEDVEEIIPVLLYPSEDAIPGEGRARSILTANLLLARDKFKVKFSKEIISLLVDNINPIVDGKVNQKNTELNIVVNNLATSPYCEELRDVLLDGYLNSKGDRRSTIGSILGSYIIKPILEKEENSIEVFKDNISRVKGKNEREQLFEILKLMTFSYENQDLIHRGETKIIHNLIDLLLTIDEEREGIQSASIWTIGWLIQAKEISENGVKLKEDQINHLLQFLSNPNHDSNTLYWTCLSLSCIENIELPPDWILEWAMIADGQKEWGSLSAPPTSVERRDIPETLQNVLTGNYHKIAKEGAAISLGRLGIYQKEAMDYYLNIFLSEQYSDITRKEAISYMVQIDSSKVASKLYNIYELPANEVNDYIQSYSFLALLVKADMEILKKMLVSGKNEVGVPGDRIAIIYSMLGNNYSEATKVLEELAKNGSEKIFKQLIKRFNDGLDTKEKIKAIQSSIRKFTFESEKAMEQTVAILLTRGESPNGGGDIFAYVAVRTDRLEEFMEAQNGELFYPEDYGVVIESGFGEPNESIKKKMENEYGFNHNLMLHLN